MGSKVRQEIADVLRSLDERMPPDTAEDWDSVGLLIGDLRQKTSGAVLSIDLTQEAIQLAAKQGYSLVITHHPCIFPKKAGLGRVLAGTLVYEAVQKGISVAAYHTSFDRCALQAVTSVSQGLGIEPKGRLFERKSGNFVKLVTYVPETHLEAVREAICRAGAGQIGRYDFCTFGVKGEGTFRGGDGTQPFLGKPHHLEKVKEFRLEAVLPRGLEQAVLNALKAAHPYEEIAFDWLSLEQPPGQLGLIKGLGYGFWGDFPAPRPFSEFVKDVKRLFNIHGFWITNPSPTQVSRVGFVAGKGASFVGEASALGCDLMLTGEVGYHSALGGLRRGMAVMELGHRESELFFFDAMKTWLDEIGLDWVEAKTPTQRIWSVE